MRSIRVEVSRKLLDQFKREAKLAFPREKFAYLVGHDCCSDVYVEDLYFPDGVDACCTEDTVNVRPHWIIEARAHASDIEAEVLGDIHSHPFRHGTGDPDRSPSEHDIDRAWGSIYGICLVHQDRNKRLRSSIRFWAAQPPVEVMVK